MHRRRAVRSRRSRSPCPARAACSSSRSVRRVGAIPASSKTTSCRAGGRRRCVDVDQAAVDRARRDPGLVGELARRPRRRRQADHRVSGALVELAQHARGVGLAGPRERLDHVDAVAGARDGRTTAPDPSFSARSLRLDRAFDRARVESRRRLRPAPTRAASISARSQATRSAVVIVPPRVASTSSRPRNRSACRGRVDPRALRAAAANSCSTLARSNVFARSVSPDRPGQLVAELRSLRATRIGLHERPVAGRLADARAVRAPRRSRSTSSRSSPCSAARAMISSRQVCVSIPYCLRSRVSIAPPAARSARAASGRTPPRAAAPPLHLVHGAARTLAAPAGHVLQLGRALMDRPPLQTQPLADLARRCAW